MIWFKETGQLIQSCPRLTHQELGILYCLVIYAWNKQGINESDIEDFAKEQRLSPETAQIAWADFRRIAVQKQDKWLLSTQWEGIETYHQKVQAGKQRAEKRIQKIKELQSYSLNRQAAATGAPLDVRSTDLDLDLEENKKSKSHSSPRTAKQAKRTPEESALKDWCHRAFNNSYLAQYNAPYTAKPADFIHFWSLLDACRVNEWRLTEDRWMTAQKNYFATPTVHTFADFCTKFSIFYKSALDRYGKPAAMASAPPVNLNPNRGGQGKVVF